MDEEDGSTSLGIEYAWNDHAMALWGDSLGRSDEATQMAEAAGWWRNNWDPSQGFMLGRYADGSFHNVVDPDVWNTEYVEGNSWHYRWPAPYDVAGMVDLQYGGDVDAFGADLGLYWTRVAEEEDDVFPDTYYWHGNEPDLHHPWLGSLVGLPEHSLPAVRHVMSTRYDTSPSGLDGNDDAGTLSAWYLFAALGIYPVAGTPDYAVTSPLFERVEIDRPDGMLVFARDPALADSDLPGVVLLGEEQAEGWVLSHRDLITSGGLFFAP
jgi:putative alpha-1,2-mannosidase